RTPFYSGCERISRLINARVVYFDITRPRRGYYHVRIIPVADDLRATPTFAITRRYAELLEQSIQRDPAYWLWSHNRWKRTWDDFCRTFPDEKERKRIMSKL
ncbi:MAG: acetyltransferase, partial [Bacteroidaceae bacterium]|nr:acetyltransferase [Bacteroidaceae bacterium]